MNCAKAGFRSNGLQLPRRKLTDALRTDAAHVVTLKLHASVAL